MNVTTRFLSVSKSIAGRGALAILLAGSFGPGVRPVSAQSPSGAGFWVTLPDGQRVPYNHPLALGVKGAAPAPSAPAPAAPAVPRGAVLTPSDPGFWVTLPNGARLPYNHPDAIAALGGAPAAPSAPAAAPSAPAAPSAVLSPSDPGFWVVLPSGARVPYNHPDAIAAQGKAPAPVPTQPAAPSQPAPTQAAPAPRGGATLRVLQWNLHHGVGTDGRYDIARIASWMARMAPDVILLNEVEKNTYWGHEDQPAIYAALMQQLTGRHWYALFAQEFGDGDANGKGHLILSTYPFESIARQAISYDRVIGAAGITVNGRAVSLIVTHLDPDSQTRRLTQAREVTSWSGSLGGNRILTGDMNAWPDQSSIAELNTRYRDSWTDAAGRGQATGFAGLDPAGATRNGRIDYIFYARDAANLAVIDSRVYDTRSGSTMPSDHRPVVTTFDVH